MLCATLHASNLNECGGAEEVVQLDGHSCSRGHATTRPSFVALGLVGSAHIAVTRALPGYTWPVRGDMAWQTTIISN